jgi:hypothetical protein
MSKMKPTLKSCGQRACCEDYNYGRADLPKKIWLERLLEVEVDTVLLRDSDDVEEGGIDLHKTMSITMSIHSEEL